MLALLGYLVLIHFDIIWNLQKLQSCSVIKIPSKHKDIHILHLLWSLMIHLKPVSILDPVLQVVKIDLNAFKPDRLVAMINYHPLYRCLSRICSYCLLLCWLGSISILVGVVTVFTLFSEAFPVWKSCFEISSGFLGAPYYMQQNQDHAENKVDKGCSEIFIRVLLLSIFFLFLLFVRIRGVSTIFCTFSRFTQLSDFLVF